MTWLLAALAASAPHSATVRLDEWSVRPAVREVSPGRVTFRARNSGRTTHELVVLRTSKRAGALGSGNRVSERGSAGEVGDVKAGRSGTVTLHLRPGHYALVCNLPGHYHAGMHADLVVR